MSFLEQKSQPTPEKEGPPVWPAETWATQYESSLKERDTEDLKKLFQEAGQKREAIKSEDQAGKNEYTGQRLAIKNILEKRGVNI